MLFLIFFVPIGLISGYLAYNCVRQKHKSAALLMGGVSVFCLVISMIIVAAGLFFVKAT
jgi:hypothetical protein